MLSRKFLIFFRVSSFKSSYFFISSLSGERLLFQSARGIISCPVNGSSLYICLFSISSHCFIIGSKLTVKKLVIFCKTLFHLFSGRGLSVGVSGVSGVSGV